MPPGTVYPHQFSRMECHGMGEEIYRSITRDGFVFLLACRASRGKGEGAVNSCRYLAASNARQFLRDHAYRAAENFLYLN